MYEQDQEESITDNEVLLEWLYVDESLIHGTGVFARVTLEEGEYLGTYDGPHAVENDTYVLWHCDENGDWVGRDGKNILRYLNHSRDPNAICDGYDVYALREIAPHEEITIDYGEDPE